MKKSIYILIIAIICYYNLKPDDLSNINQKFFTQGVNNAGTDFWISVPPAYVETYNPTDFIKLFIISAHTQTIKVESIDGIQKQLTVQANDVIEINLTPEEAQPYMFKFPQTTVPPSKVYQGKGIHVYGQKPFSLYVVCRYTATSDGYLAIPTKSLGKDYVVTSYGSFPWSSAKFPAMVTIVGTQDNTRVSVRVGGNTISSLTTDNGEIFPGEEVVYKIDKGDVLLLSNPRDQQIIAGTTIRANKPVSVQSGMFCAQIPIGNTACDYTVEMDSPIQTWGKNYHIPLTLDRTNSNILRIFAKEDNTVVYRDGVEVMTLPKGLFGSDSSAGIENKGWKETRIWPIGVTPPKIATYSGNKPIYLMLYNQGATEDAAQFNSTDRDPFSMLMLPIEQYQNSLALCSPGINGGNPFTKNYLSIIYETEENGEMPDSLLFGEVNDGLIEWIQLKLKDSKTDSEYYKLANSDIIELKESPFANQRFKFKRIDIDPAGIFYIKSPKKIMAYSFGGAYYDSYGYPSSSGLLDLITYDNLAPSITWNPNCKGEIMGAIAFEQPLNDSSSVSGFSYLDISEDESVNYKLIKVELSEINVDGKIFNGTIDAAPIDPTKYGKLALYAIDKAGNDTTFIYEYYPQLVTLSNLNKTNNSLDFGLVTIRRELDFQIYVNNLSIIKDIVISKIELSDTLNFKILNVKDKLPLTVKKNDSLPIDLSFFSIKRGNNSAKLNITTECGVNSFDLKALVGGPESNVDDVKFEKYVIDSDLSKNTAQKISFQVKNSCLDDNYDGILPLEISEFVGPTNSAFKLISPNSFTINPKDSRYLQLEFLPTEPGIYQDSIVFLADPEFEYCDLVCKIEAVAEMLSSVKETINLINARIIPSPIVDESSVLDFNLIQSGRVTIRICDLVGNCLFILNDEYLNNGSHTFNIPINKLVAGVYIYEIIYQNEIISDKFEVVK